MLCIALWTLILKAIGRDRRKFNRSDQKDQPTMETELDLKAGREIKYETTSVNFPNDKS